MDGVVVVEAFTVDPRWERDSVTAWLELADNALDAPGRGRTWWLLRDPERRGRLVGITEWASTEAFHGWASVPRYPEAVNALRNLAKASTRTTFELAAKG